VSLLMVLAVGLGGAAGALLRALAGRWIRSAFPLATLLVNVTGCLVLAAASMGLPADPGWTQALLGSGFCGALTTFSTFILETVILFRSGQRQRAGVYLALTLILCCLASWAGFCLMS
jgi:CrcB protein